MRLSEIDWPGYVVLAVGLAAFILFIKQGDRFFWLIHLIIRHAGLIAALAIPLALVLFLVKRRPLLDLGLMATPTFGWAIVIATFYRFGLVMTAFVVPQALGRPQGFRIEQIADANIWTFWAQCVSFPFAWLWASRGDPRLPLSFGLALFAAGAFVCAHLTPQWQAGDFRSRAVQTANDAYVRGEITDLSSRVSGYTVEVLADDGMPVKATDFQLPRRQCRSRPSRHVGGNRRRGPHTRQRYPDGTRYSGWLLVRSVEGHGSPSCRSILDWAGLVLRALPAHRFR